jgi:EAL domain-containing protein (putative c-di-GMP-specific phosphodiesterase class I)
MKHGDLAVSILENLRHLGVQIAVDDFGTGYSSLSYLKKFPVDALKIDQSFVRLIATTTDDTPLVTAVISLGKSLKLRVVAEGVETQDELAFLEAHGCEEAQGYYFSRPVPADQCARLLKDGLGGHWPTPPSEPPLSISPVPGSPSPLGPATRVRESLNSEAEPV